MAMMNPQVIRRMIARLRADPHVQAMIARDAFVAVASTRMVLDLNSRSQDFRHRVAAQWCEANAEGRWRRRVVERRGDARLDRIYFEFEFDADRQTFERWRNARGW